LRLLAGVSNGAAATYYYLIVVAIVRVSVRDDLPVHPWNASLTDVVRVLLDVSVSSGSRQSITLGAVVVGGVVIAQSPFLHDELLARILRFLDVRREGVFGKIAESVCMDRNHVERGARQVRIWS
jgi:hypothetical protein